MRTVLLATSVTLGLWALGADASAREAVVLVRPQSDPLLQDAFHRLGAELELHDFDVQRVETLSWKYNRKYEAFLVKWQSQYRPQNPDFALVYQKYLEVQTAWAVVVKSKLRRNRGAVIVLHRFTGGDVRRTWRDEDLDRYVREGFDAVLLQLPYHGLRSLHGSVFSGEPFLSGEVARINEAMCQTVTDGRSMLVWLRHEGYEVVGMKGESLGAAAALMTAVVDDDLDFVLAWKPLVSFSDLSEKSPLAAPAVQIMRAGDLDVDTIKKTLWLAEPVNFDPAIPPTDENGVDHVLVFAGMGDMFSEPGQAEAIAKRWGLPAWGEERKLVWYAGGYYVNFDSFACKEKERLFLQEVLLDPKLCPEAYSKNVKTPTRRSAGDLLTPRSKAKTRFREGYPPPRWYQKKWWQRKRPVVEPEYYRRGLDSEDKPWPEPGPEKPGRDHPPSPAGASDPVTDPSPQDPDWSWDEK
jgi:hypothetical protein